MIGNEYRAIIVWDDDDGMLLPVESFICSVDISSDGMLINALGKLNVSIVVSKMLYNVKDTRVNEMRKWRLLRLESL